MLPQPCRLGGLAARLCKSRATLCAPSLTHARISRCHRWLASRMCIVKCRSSPSPAVALSRAFGRAHFLKRTLASTLLMSFLNDFFKNDVGFVGTFDIINSITFEASLRKSLLGQECLRGDCRSTRARFERLLLENPAARKAT